MRVLLTGASGFVGRPVMRLLIDAGHEVHAVSSRAPASASATWHHADLLQRDQGQRLIDAVRPEGLVHLAWFATPPDYWQSPANLAWAVASADLFNAFHRAGGRRIVAAGTCAEYDWRYGYCVERLTPLAPATPYGRAKADAGAALESCAAGAGLSAAWARLFFLFGPHDHDARLVPSLVRNLRAGKPAQCRSGSLIRDFLHVDDAAAAIVALLESGVTGPVNIASGVPTAVATVARAVAERLGRSELLELSPGDDPHPLVVGSVLRLHKEVGWSPARDVETSLDMAVDWWIANVTAKVEA